MHTVTWVFKNDHKYTKAFETENELVMFVNSCALVTHPDIISVVVTSPSGADFVLKKA